MDVAFVAIRSPGSKTLAPRIPVRTEVHSYPLDDVNRALEDLRQGRFTGAAVIVVGPAAGARGRVRRG